MARKNSKVVVIGAHPDDFEIGAGMRIMHHIGKKDCVVGIICSDGEKGGDPTVRLKESKKSAKSLGIKKMYMLHLPDSNISDLMAIKDQIEKIVEKEKPTIVYTHFKEDTHQDHRIVSQATSIACRKIPVILAYKSPSTITSEFQPHLFHVGTERDFRKKEKIVGLYKSQILKKGRFDLRRIRVEASYYAASLHLKENLYAEPFCANHFILNLD
jgi:LmbE family N-acetylglucosaminyl deacetylase